MSDGPRLRVLVVTAWYPTAAQPGRGAFVREQARAVAREHDVVVLAIEPARGLDVPFVIADADENGLRTIRLRHAPIGGVGLPAYAPGLALAARRLRPDLVHAHVFSVGLVAATLARAWHAPLVISEHLSRFQLGTLGPAGRAAARVAFRVAARTCAPSESLRRALVPYAPAARLRVVPHSVDTERFRPPAEPRGGRDRLLYVGNLEPVKGVDTLLDAVALLRRRRPGVTLELAGDGARRAAYEAQARRLGLGGAVRFRGGLTGDEVAEAMRAADVLLAPSRTETFGVAVAEAQACGLPVVATAVGALPEVLASGGGVLVPPEDPAALADAAERVLSGLLGYDAGAVAGSARERFAREVVAHAWTAIYAEATAGRRLS